MSEIGTWQEIGFWWRFEFRHLFGFAHVIVIANFTLTEHTGINPTHTQQAITPYIFISIGQILIQLVDLFLQLTNLCSKLLPLMLHIL